MTHVHPHQVPEKLDDLNDVFENDRVPEVAAKLTSDLAPDVGWHQAPLEDRQLGRVEAGGGRSRPQVDVDGLDCPLGDLRDQPPKIALLQPVVVVGNQVRGHHFKANVDLLQDQVGLR